MAAGDPTGDDLCSGTTNGNTLPEAPAAPEEREIDFGDGTELTEGVTYAIVARAPDAINYNDAAWDMEFDGGYAGGKRKYSRDDGVTWSGETNDLWFKAYAEAVLKDNYQPTYEGSGSAIGVYGDSYYLSAQTFVATSTYTITKVVVKLYRGAGDSPGTITISIKATESGLPGKPTNPSPTDDATDITLDHTLLSWDASDPAADTYEIYFREQGDDWELVGEAQAGVEWTIDFGTLDYGITYEWRIDATNDAGTTTGDTWTFGCISFDPPLPSGITLVDGEPTGTPTGENNMYTVKRLIIAANNKIFYEDV